MANPSAQLLIAGVAGWNVLINRRIPDSRYVPANMAAAATLTATSLLSGSTKEELGLDRCRIGTGFRWGAVGAAAAAAAIATGARWRRTQALFADQRASRHDVPYQTLVRIPLGTVLLEEVLFRGVLPAHLEPGRPIDLKSSVLFGLWHVLPTLSTLDINSIDRKSTRLKAVAVSVVATTAAGLGFGWLRRRTGSLIAPALIHWGANAAAYAVAAGRRE